MNVKELFTDENAVSPVIGVILMVAITVILAAVIGAFVLNIGGSQESAPSSSLDFENTTDGVKITHASGAPLKKAQTSIKVTNSSDTVDVTLPYDTFEAGDVMWVHDNSTTGSGAIGVNKSAGAPVEPDTEIRVVWESPSSDKSSIIGQFTA